MNAGARAKRLLDLAIAVPASILTAPILLFAMLLVRLRLGSPVLFRQSRPGLHGKPFLLFKLRTMTDARDADGRLLPDAARLTPLGHWLRRLSIDELPQLLNVLRGDMSLVGPRPQLLHYLQHYSARQARRHEVLPGIVGWAQLHGRNAISWPERLELDVWYVDHRSFTLDCRILLRSLLQVLRMHGVNAPGHVSMPEFAPEFGTANASDDAQESQQAASEQART